MLRRFASAALPAAFLAPLLALGLSAGSASAAPSASDTSLAGVSPDNIAGLLNFCTQVEYISYDEGNPPLDGLIAKYHSVNMTGGSKDYAIGTAGLLNHNGTNFDIKTLPLEQKKAVCASAVKAAQPLL